MTPLQERELILKNIGEIRKDLATLNNEIVMLRALLLSTLSQLPQLGLILENIKKEKEIERQHPFNNNSQTWNIPTTNLI